MPWPWTRRSAALPERSASLIALSTTGSASSTRCPTRTTSAVASDASGRSGGEVAAGSTTRPAVRTGIARPPGTGTSRGDGRERHPHALSLDLDLGLAAPRGQREKPAGRPEARDADLHADGDGPGQRGRLVVPAEEAERGLARRLRDGHERAPRDRAARLQVLAHALELLPRLLPQRRERLVDLLLRLLLHLRPFGGERGALLLEVEEAGGGLLRGRLRLVRLLAGAARFGLEARERRVRRLPFRAEALLRGRRGRARAGPPSPRRRARASARSRPPARGTWAGPPSRRTPSRPKGRRRGPAPTPSRPKGASSRS